MIVDTANENIRIRTKPRLIDKICLERKNKTRENDRETKTINQKITDGKFHIDKI
jgi:hypothetical protein